jgi:hypothetical protein
MTHAPAPSRLRAAQTAVTNLAKGTPPVSRSTCDTLRGPAKVGGGVEIYVNLPVRQCRRKALCAIGTLRKVLTPLSFCRSLSVDFSRF